jgi:PAS domain S-box-containing protein
VNTIFGMYQSRNFEVYFGMKVHKTKPKDLGIMKIKPNRSILITLKFVIGGILWIIFSDTLLNYFSGQIPDLSISHLQILKGIFFVGMMGAAIFLVLHDYTQDSLALRAEMDLLFKVHHLPIAIIDCESYRFLDMNQKALGIFGYSPREFKTLLLGDLVIPEERERFEQVLLFLKTGFDKLGTWKFISSSNEIFLAELSAKKLASRNVFLITFTDVTEKSKIENELFETKRNIQHQIAKRTEHLERLNEELAYRTSQTEHVNAELILVNEQLLFINKKVAAEIEKVSDYNSQIKEIFSALRQVICSFQLSGGDDNYFSPGVEDLFEEVSVNALKPWFWVELIHPEDKAIKEIHQREVFERGETFCVFRIVTKSGTVRKLFVHIKLQRTATANVCLVCSFSDLSGFPVFDSLYAIIKTA